MCGSCRTGRRSTAGRRRRGGAGTRLKSRRSGYPPGAAVGADLFDRLPSQGRLVNRSLTCIRSDRNEDTMEPQRITVEEVKQRRATGESVVFLDARADDVWQ